MPKLLLVGGNQTTSPGLGAADIATELAARQNAVTSRPIGYRIDHHPALRAPPAPGHRPTHLDCPIMEQAERTFPTLRRWRRMSESEQDALLDKIESRRRWRAFAVRAAIAFVCTVAAIIGVALVLAR